MENIKQIEKGNKTLYKKGRTVKAYIKPNGNSFLFCTGKPSDPCCIGWNYDSIKEAKESAKDYFENAIY